MERPALERLLADIEAGKVDCVVVYKVDRLSRVLLDFARIMEVFDQRKVSFVSVTQQFNTATSMGRLVLNVLLSFAQFEREIIGERIRDKIAAQRRKGKWTGGTPVLGYDVDRSGRRPKLVVNAAEAARVREIFDLYLHTGRCCPSSRNWPGGAGTTRRGRRRRASRWAAVRSTSGSLYALLTNPFYVGQGQAQDQRVPGEHEAIVDPDVFQQVQAHLQHNGRSGGVEVRNRYGALLKRLLYCKACGKAMVHTFTDATGSDTATTPACRRSRAGGRPAPPAPCRRRRSSAWWWTGSAASPRTRSSRADVVRQARAVAARRRGRTADGTPGPGTGPGQVPRRDAEAGCQGSAKGATAARIADLNDALARVEARLAEVRRQIEERAAEQVDERDVAAAFADFDAIWNVLSPREQAQALETLVARVEYDAAESTIAVSFHDSGIKALARSQQGGRSMITVKEKIRVHAGQGRATQDEGRGPGAPGCTGGADSADFQADGAGHPVRAADPGRRGQRTSPSWPGWPRSRSRG